MNAPLIMTRSLLQPVRRHSVHPTLDFSGDEAHTDPSALTPGTRKTLATIGELWLSFAATASASASFPLAPAIAVSLPDFTRADSSNRIGCEASRDWYKVLTEK